MKRRAWLVISAIATFIFAMLGGGVYLRERAAVRRRDESNEALADANRKTAGELAKVREREAREQAINKRASAEAAAHHKADLDARIISLGEYVKSRKR